MKTISVQVQADHLERLTSVGSPIEAISELIWNSLDADASVVKVNISHNSLGGLSRIRVSDNGHGLPYSDAEAAFESLGGSWKRGKGRTRQGRLLHGKLGKGRFRAFYLGDRVHWTSRFVGNNGLEEFTIIGRRSNLREFSIGDLHQARSSGPGMMVEIGDIARSPSTLESTARAVQALAEEFALYLRQYPSIELYYGRSRVNPSAIEERIDDYNLEGVEVEEERAVNGSLTIIEWKISTDRALYLCDENGFTLWQVSPGIQAPGFNFTAYLKSSYIRELEESHSLALEDLHPGLKKLLLATKEKMKEHFRGRRAEESHHLVDQWKKDAVYPYQGEPSNILEEAERKVFDVIALNVNSYLPDFEESNTRTKRLSFRLLREALESSPSTVQEILQDVLQLPVEKREELVQLLRQTSLEAIINASKMVANRLDFLAGLEMLVFDPQSKKQLLERRHLHRIIAEHTWIFGEEFNLTVNDRSLTEVLRRHLELSQVEFATDAPVLREDGSEGIVDLMLSRKVPQAKPDRREHLIIELKRPKVPIDDRASLQIRQYAFAIAGDERFKGTNTGWVFWAISNNISDSVEREVNQRDRPEGLLFEDREGSVRIWVKTWSQILEDCRSRLRFFEQALRYTADENSALDYLRKMHEKYLPKTFKVTDS